jgi:hypothetical protein
MIAWQGMNENRVTTARNEGKLLSVEMQKQFKENKIYRSSVNN